MAYHKRDIFELERKVKEAFAKDKSSPDMYTTIKDLAAAILVVKRMAFYSDEVEEISHMCAAEFYLKINHEGLVVEKWTKYIRLRLYKFRSDYLNEVRGVELEIDDCIEAERFRDYIFGPGNFAYEEQKKFELEDAIRSLSNLVLEVFDNYVHYQPDTEDYINTKLSVMFTIEDKIKYNRGRIVLIKLDESQESYVRFLVILIYKRVGVYLHKLFGDDLSRSSEMNELLLNCWNIDNTD